MIRFAIPLLALAAGACMHDGRPEMPAPGVQCDANGLGRFVGQQRSARVEMRIKRISGARIVRWLEPGAMMTMDFRTDRLNINVDKRGRITGTRCG
jgi:hypothetical protein